MYFIIGLPKVLGKDCMFVVVDRINKFVHLFVVTTTFSDAQVVELFFREVCRLHGLPNSIVSDRDSRFFSAFWKELFKMVGQNLNPYTIYHPNVHGQTERVNQWLEG